MPRLDRTVTLYLAGRVARKEIARITASGYRMALRQFCDHVGKDVQVASVGRRQVETYMGSLNVEVTTMHNRFAALRGFFLWCVVEGYVGRDPTAGVKLPRMPRRVPRKVPADGLRRVLGGAPDSRERLILTLMYSEGLRRCEVANLELGDVDTVAASMTVTGKGGHMRTLPLTDETRVALERYLEVRGTRAGKLIRAVPPYDRRADGGLDPQRIGRIVSAALKREGITESGHALRHTFAHNLVDAGATILEVKDALGHASIATTQIYSPLVAVPRLRELMGQTAYQQGAT